MKPAEELKKMGYADGYESFEELVCDTFTTFCPSWTDEVLLEHPTQAAAFCRAVSARCGLKGARDDREFLITRALVNNRKCARRPTRAAR